MLLREKTATPNEKGFKGFGGGSSGGGGSEGSWAETTPKKVTAKNEARPVAPTTIPNECDWEPSQMPRIVFAPGCSGKGSRLCRGTVICGNKKRLAVCSENFCTPNTATECVKQKGYSHSSLADALPKKL